MVYTRGTLKPFILQTGKVIGLLAVCIILARLVILIPARQNHSEDSCKEVAIEYESKTVYSEKVPEGEEFEAQEGEDGVRRICHSPFEVGEADETVVKEPTSQVTVSGSGELPPEANTIHSSIDYRLSWDSDLGDVTRNFTDEAYTHYCESIELDDDYIDDWEEYCADR